MVRWNLSTFTFLLTLIVLFQLNSLLFTATVLQNEKAMQLNWTTATETNNSGFEIANLPKEGASTPFPREGAREWLEKIGFVPGFGTTTEPKSYSFIDENVTDWNLQIPD